MRETAIYQKEESHIKIIISEEKYVTNETIDLLVHINRQ